MSSSALPDNSRSAGSPEKPHRARHRILPFSAIPTYRGEESELLAILKQAMEKTAATGAAIALVAGNDMCCRASTGVRAPEVGTRLQGGASLTRLCVDTGEIVLCNDTYTDPRVDHLCKESGVRSVLALPIKQNAKVVGVLEVMSMRPDAFVQYELAAVTNLAAQVMPILSESKIQDRCIEPLPGKDIDAIPDFQECFAATDVSEDHNNHLSTANGAEAIEPKAPYIGSQPSDQTPNMTSQGQRPPAHWLAIVLTAMLSLAVIGYGYHLNHPRTAPHVAVLPIAASVRAAAIPPPDVLLPDQNKLSEQNKKTNAPTETFESVITATRQEAILAIQEPIQNKDINRILAGAQVGDSVAQYELALRYADGEGVAQNYQDAMAWFSKAAANGNEKAQWKLGLGYLNGIGVPKDEREAALWFKRAANRNDVRAQNSLSDLYLSGRGVPTDYVRAYTWAGIAAGQGNDSNRLRLIGTRMTAPQIADARRRISIWWEHQRQLATLRATSQRPVETSAPSDSKQ
jgi:putative methionine-R-sulfoxide reductase with GAF domain